MTRDAFAAVDAEPVKVTLAKELAPLVVDLATAARLVGVSDRHLRKFLNELPHVRIGGRLLFRVERLNEWLAAREATEAKGGEHDPQP